MNNTSAIVAPDGATPKKKNVAYRVFAALLAALAIGVFFVPFTYVITFAGIKEMSFFEAIKLLFTDGAYDKLFGFIPSLVPTEPINGLFAVLSLYLMMLCSVLTVIFGIISIFCSKKAPAMLRITTYFFTIGFGIYSLYTLWFSYLYWPTLVLDYVSLGLTAFGMILFFVLACIKLGGKAVINAVQAILSLVLSSALVLTIAKDYLAFHLGLATFGIASLAEIVIISVIGVGIVNWIIASLRVATKKGLIPDLIRYIFLLLIAGVLLYFQIAYTTVKFAFIVAIVAASVALVQMVICIIQIVLAKKAKKAAKKAAMATVSEETEEPAPVEETKEEAPVAVEPVVEEEVYVRDEFAEALPYEGGPVEGVELAEEIVEEPVAPAPEAAPAVETADYDYYNSKSFDPFIATLSTEERNQFTELYIVKYKGTMPEIPDYEVGGNNKQFFRKVFIYLGQYRDRIPDGLLSKMYEYATKL